jgi:hypothetical protein
LRLRRSSRLNAVDLTNRSGRWWWPLGLVEREEVWTSRSVSDSIAAVGDAADDELEQGFQKPFENHQKSAGFLFLAWTRKGFSAVFFILFNFFFKKNNTSIHKYMTSLIFFENFNHSSYSKYLFKNIKF